MQTAEGKRFMEMKCNLQYIFITVLKSFDLYTESGFGLVKKLSVIPW